MKFHHLTVQNLRAVKNFSITNLGSFVVIAGQNGCGKSCICDALRLLKSIYGGYSANEYQQWFGEFAINLADKSALAKLFRDPTREIRIEAELSFAPSEIAYVRDNLSSLAAPLAWQTATGQPADFYTFSRTSLLAQMRAFQPQLLSEIERISADVTAHLDDTTHSLSCTISPHGDIVPTPSPVAELIFQAYAPQALGVLEYHSASRTYSRQQVGGINLDARAFEDQMRQQRLYNSQNKYQNVKTELASAYLRRLIAAEAGITESAPDLNDTLRELFTTFFPDKEYLGVTPKPSGSLDFPVKLRSGEIHDIDEMSSGEKEILYGYLKLKNSTPKNSVILLDEPELHLNPSLLQGFTDFYYRHLGVEQSNQLWMVTHSDTLLRQSVGNINFRVFQMMPALTVDGEQNQAAEVLADDDLERATIALVGDLATYRPHGKVVILEGETVDGFDKNMIERLFPDFARRVNLLSGSNKQRVRGLYSVLDEVASGAGIRNRFFAITDRDLGQNPPVGATEFQWGVYHIENYLLEPDCIIDACRTLYGQERFPDADSCKEALRVCAEELVDGIVLQRLQDSVNTALVGAINVRGNPATTNPAGELLPSIGGSRDRISALAESFDEARLQDMAQAYREELVTALTSDEWMKVFPGRKILRRFTDSVFGGHIAAHLFMNAVLDSMVKRERKPDSMKSVLDAIIEA